MITQPSMKLLTDWSTRVNKAHVQRRIEQLIHEHKNALLEAWNHHFGG